MMPWRKPGEDLEKTWRRPGEDGRLKVCMVFFTCVQCAVLMCEYSFNTLGGGWGCLANPFSFQAFLSGFTSYTSILTFC